MKEEHTRISNFIQTVWQNSEQLPSWYMPTKYICLCLGFLTALVDAMLLAVCCFLYVRMPEKVLTSYSPFLSFGIGLLVGAGELLLWFNAQTLFERSVHISTNHNERSYENAPAHQEDALAQQKHSSSQLAPVTTTPLPEIEQTPSTDDLSAMKTAVNIQSQPLIRDPLTTDKQSAPARPDRAKFYTYNQAIRFYAVPREGNDIVLSADKKAVNEKSTRFALADGVGTSFLPAHWAEILTDQFVKRENDFENAQDFENWLRHCSFLWHSWFETTWLPIAREKSGQADWSSEENRGASTTFIGCSLSWEALQHNGQTPVHVTAVGDAVFFLVSPQQHAWTHRSFSLQKADEFGPTTETLGSPERRIARDWRRVKQADFVAERTDTLVLATDALAEWIMYSQEQGQKPWDQLLNITSTDHFKRFISTCRSNGMMEVDDTSILIIPLNEAKKHMAG